MDSETRITVEEMAEGLAPGQSRRGVCPTCGGGEHQEKSFVVRNNDGHITFRCYRATCARHAGYYGMSSVPSVSGGEQGVAGRALDPYDGELLPLPPDVLQTFKARYGLSAAELSSAGFMWTPEKRIYMPVYGPNGQLRGSQLRAYGTTSRLKVVAKPESYSPWQAFYKLGTGRPDGMRDIQTLVIVEDQISALKVSRQYHSVALLGTDFSPDRAMEVAHLGAQKYIFAMDADATAKALDMMYESALLLSGEVYTAFLCRDFKDSTDEEIRTIITEAMR